MTRHTPRTLLRRVIGERDPERGASPASVIIVLAIILMAAELIVMGGRMAAAHAEVTGAAREAARRGSTAQTASSVRPIAVTTALDNVAQNTRHCLNANVDTDNRDFRPGGSVTVTVNCRVQLSDLSLLSLPWGSITVEADATEVVEFFRVVD